MEAERSRATLIFIHGAGHNRISHFFNTSSSMTALKSGRISVHLDSETTVTLNIPMATFVWVLRNTATCSAKRWLDARFDSNQPQSYVVCPGGATAIYALATGCRQTYFCFDPVLNTRDVLERVGWVGSGLPAVLFRPMAYLAPIFWNSITATLMHSRLLRPCPYR